MATDALIFKGLGRGARRELAISIPREMRLDELLEALRIRLQESEGFFAGTPVMLDGRPLDEEERRHVRDLIAQFGMTLKEPDEVSEESALYVSRNERSAEPEPVLEQETVEVPGPPDDQTLLVRRTLRSGQRIFYEGNVVVLGDVNPGAMVTCSGDIVVMGRLRGVAHAGASGNVAARVMAFRLQPTQLRIAHYISRSPDDGDEGPGWPEVAVVHDGVIEIQTFAP